MEIEESHITSFYERASMTRTRMQEAPDGGLDVENTVARTATIIDGVLD
jgi:hypothetical protein